MADGHERRPQTYDYPVQSSAPCKPQSEQQPQQNDSNHQRQYSPPAFHKIPHEDRHIPQQDPQAMNGLPLHAYRPIYDNNWQSPPSPPKSSTRSRLADEHLVRPSARFAHQPHHLDDKHQARVTRYRRRSPSSGYESDSSYDDRRRSRNRVRSRGQKSHRGSKAGNNQLQPAQPQPPAEQPKTGLEAIITPLRLGILLGCFDIVGGSLSVWMTRKRFGKAAQQAAAASGQQTKADQRSRVSSKHPRRSTTSRRGERYHPYDSDTGSETDSDYEERLRRTADHVREQRRLEYERDRGLSRAPREIRDGHGLHGRRR